MRPRHRRFRLGVVRRAIRIWYQV